ncbi:MAG: formate dehydrogenase accessory sulfurtransferase FdhD [Methylovirgula sp.]
MNEDLPKPAVSVPCVAQRGGVSFATTRVVPDEQAVAFTDNGSTHAVMMATPADLEDFAVGFALTEGLIEGRDEIESLDVVRLPLGIEIRVWLKEQRAKVYAQRRRSMAGPTGCGLCGIESLEAAMRETPSVAPSQWRFTPHAISAAMTALEPGQKLNDATHAVHAAGFFTEAEGLVALREDVGRHNALDKLIGALVRAGRTAAGGFVLTSSRVSIELIQKAARLDTPVLVAVSAPTAAAIRVAEECGITLVAVARHQDFEVFTHPERLTNASRNVA